MSILHNKIDEQEVTRRTQKAQKECGHTDSNERWVIGLTGNFPDHQDRGICPRCQLVIHPKHWASGGPNEMVLVPAHRLYPVVLLMGIRDEKLNTLLAQYTKQVDELLSNPRLIWTAERAYQNARWEIQQNFELETQKWKK